MYGDGYDDESITSTFQSHLKSIVAEYSLMRKLNGCVNIVNCDDIRYVQHDDGFGWDIFIKMELLTPLMKALPTQIPEEIAVKLGKDICNALVVCKEYGVVHRDIKPQNIFVSKYGDYKLGDFDIAKTVEKTMGGTKIGTYKYMAPEVYNNQPYGTGADIYSLGMVLYWMLNERRMPFVPLPPEKISIHMEEQARFRRLAGEQVPPPAHGSKELKEIVLKACAYDPKERYQSAQEMLMALNRVLDEWAPPIPYPNPIDNSETNNATKKNKKKWIAIFSCVAAVAVMLAVGTMLYKNEAEENPADIPTNYLIENKVENGWREMNDEMFYYENGRVKTGWQTIDSKKYCFDDRGVLLTGLQIVDGNTYYFGDDGTVYTGDCMVGDKLYHFGDDGVLRTGWHTLDGNRYYFDEFGRRLTGMQTIDEMVYFFDNEGAQQTGWQTKEKKRYYYDKDGVPATGTQDIDDILYYFDSSGVERIALIQPPENVTVAKNQKAMITLEATGDGLTYEWWTKDRIDKHYYKSSTFVSNYYRVKVDDERDRRKVYCVITDEHGNTLKTKPVVIKIG